MSPGARRETGGTRDCFTTPNRAQSMCELIGERLAVAQVPLLMCAGAVRTQTILRKRRDTAREFLGGSTRLAVRHHSIREANFQRFLRADRAPGEN